MASTNNGTPKPVRCAIYTRKSTDEGLEKDFNSLDAQREAGEAYIRSQMSEGWSLVPAQYDDGGYTGANMERPALKRLLSEIQAAKVDCVVVYKVDRLSRSIRHFARMMDVFEKQGVSFVSVTQQFNTTTSLGRLTLNVLLSFAQFEREIISERTRDKQVAARKKGKWTGGHLILGYDLDPRGSRLVINPEEAERVRSIFQSYLAGESVFSITAKTHQLGWRNKQWTTQEDKLYGGQPLRRAHIYNLLANALYTGRILVDGEFYPGEHEAIIDQQTYDLVQERLKQNSCTRDNPHRTRMESLLRGLIYCSCCGSAMYQTYSSSKERRYRYYVCSRAQQRTEEYCATRAVSAPAVEDAVVESIRRVGVHPKVLEETARVAHQTRNLMRAAWKVNTAEEGEKRLEQLARFLEHDHESAARSLREGIQEMFTLQRLQIPESLHKCLATTNLIESPHSGVRRRTRNVSRWRDAAMVQRWVASAWLLTEQHFRRIDGHAHLWALAAILGRKTEPSKKEKVA